MDNTTLQDLKEETDKMSKVLTEVSSGLKEIKEAVKEWDNFQLKIPLDPFTARTISDQILIPVDALYPGTLAATAGNYDYYFIAKRSYIIDSIEITYSTASVSGTFKVVKGASTVAVASGTDVMTTTLSTSTTANTNYTAPLKTGDAITLKAGDRLGVIVTGTLTGLANLLVMTNLKQI